MNFLDTLICGWAQGCSKHIHDSNKHIIQEIVRQVGYLPEETNSWLFFYLLQLPGNGFTCFKDGSSYGRV
jgi:hypothetical protein